MLSFFRRRMKLILWILVVVVIVTFIPWGVGVRMRFRGEKRLSAAGELFGKTVSRPDFDDACMAIRTDSLLRRVQMNDAEISQRAWERLLMLTQARREGISVSDRELARAIRAQFGGEGSFDQRVYENILRNMGLTPDVYEGWTRESLMIARLIELVRLTAWMPDEELERRRREEESRLTIRYVLDGIGEAEKGVTVGDEEIKKYYDAHMGEFKLPPTVSARYLLIPSGSAGEKAAVTEEQITQYYNDHPREFAHEKRVRARHILLKIEGKDRDTAEAAARKLADEISANLKKGTDFAALARKYSQDEKTKKKGGDLGYVESREMPKAFSDKAFAMKEGETSDVVKTPMGFHIIKVEGIQEAGTKPLDEVKGDIKALLERDQKERAQEETKRAAYARAVDISLALVDNPKLDDLAKKYSLEIKETGPFTENGTAKGIPAGGEFARAAFKTDIGSFSDIVEIPDKGYCIIVPKEKTEEKTQPFEEARAEIAKKLREQKAKAKANELAAAQRAQVEKRMKDEKLDFASACKALSIKAEESTSFTPRGFIPGIGFEPQLCAAASKLKVGELSAVFDIAKGSCFFSLMKREEPPAQDKTLGAEGFARRAMNREGGKIVGEWSKWVHDQAKMVDYTSAAARSSEKPEESEE
ncbi:MAG: peptidyl-prolyl cis-trans isomerase [Candidatus Aureabacteria bacterium]|nr:peptidyl-prolyl cis-trans isomerase [Candidatus Auribacterota bacterium]